MTQRIENGVTIYSFERWKLTRIVFWGLFGVCVLSFVALTIMWATGAIEQTWEYLVRIGGVIFAVFFLFFVPIVFEKIFKLYMPNLLNIFLYTIPVLNLVVGHSWELFYLPAVIEFDYLMHAYNGLIFVFLGISVVLIMNHAPIQNKNLSIGFTLFFAFCFSMFIEYMWEILEFIVDTFAPDANMQEWSNSLVGEEAGKFIHDYFRGNAIRNTIMDMLYHAIATLATCVGCYIYLKKDQSRLYRIGILSRQQVAYFTAQSQTAISEASIDPLQEATLNEKESDDLPDSVS